MNPADLATTTRVIRQAIAEHMPSAAVASGWCSPVDPEPWVRWVSGLIPYVDRPEEMGLTRLTAWLKTMGIEAGREYIMALRADWITCVLAAESRRSPAAVYFHACTR